LAKKNKRLGDDPFERFLPQIQDTRKKKDSDINNDDDADKNSDKNKNSSVNVDKNKNNDVAVNVNNDVDKNVNNDVNVNNGNYNDAAIAVNDNITKNVVDDIDADGSVAVGSDDATDISSDVYSDAAVSSDVAGDDSAVSVSGTFKIQKKTPKSAHYTRATFYLRPDQLRTINRLHKDSGRDKSELVRIAVDILIKQARVE
jgi:hypothetical protein